MCGIVGIISKRKSGFTNSDQEMFRKLLVLDGEFRGLDSTGVFQVQSNRQAFITKAACIPSLLFYTQQWKSFNERMYSGSRVVIGHNRKSTMGATNSANAHPFHEDNIILVHNGTLHNHGKLAKDVEVDSHAVCKAFAAGEAEKVLPTIDGAFAFVWWDIQRDRLFAVRNKERPLALVETDDNVYIASEPWMVYAFLQRDHVPREKIKITELPPGELFEFDVFSGQGSYKSTTIELAKEVQRYPFPGTSGQGTTTYMRTPSTTATGNTQTSSQAQTGGTTTTESSTAGTNLVVSNDSCNDCAGGDVDLGERPRVSTVALFPNYEKVLPNGKQVMVRLTSGQGTGTTNAHRMVGRIMHPGLPELDVSGVLTGVTAPELQDWFESPIIGTVNHITEHLAGPVVHLRALEKDLIVNTFHGSIGFTEWEWIVDHCKCSKCSSHLTISDASLTFIKRLAIGEKARYHIDCKECLNHITSGESDEKQQPSDPAVQDGKRQLRRTGGSAVLRLTQSEASEK